ncbi:MAG: hypothetical protein MUF31_12375 [Akkermansiaceae bacterium]|jgi:hypothetical protein|nr:hypothetical protein [Akkermansiaceae bacterium]
MTTTQVQNLQLAYSQAQAVALRGGLPCTKAASAEVEAKLTRLLVVTAGFFGLAVSAVIAVGASLA